MMISNLGLAGQDLLVVGVEEAVGVAARHRQSLQNQSRVIDSWCCLMRGKEGKIIINSDVEGCGWGRCCCVAGLFWVQRRLWKGKLLLCGWSILSAEIHIMHLILLTFSKRQSTLCSLVIVSSVIEKGTLNLGPVNTPWYLVHCRYCRFQTGLPHCCIQFSFNNLTRYHFRGISVWKDVNVNKE